MKIRPTFAGDLEMATSGNPLVEQLEQNESLPWIDIR
jgi:hypothetical protein